MSRYITNVALAIDGERYEPGAEIALTEEQAAAHDPADLIPVDAIPAEEEQPTEPSVDDPNEMNLTQLKARAKALGLKQSGSVADLRERIELHLQSSMETDSDEDGSDEQETDSDEDGSDEQEGA